LALLSRLYKYFEEHPEEKKEVELRKNRILDEQLALAKKISEQPRSLDKAA
jgi:hypothetical protein